MPPKKKPKTTSEAEASTPPPKASKSIDEDAPAQTEYMEGDYIRSRSDGASTLLESMQSVAPDYKNVDLIYEFFITHPAVHNVLSGNQKPSKAWLSRFFIKLGRRKVTEAVVWAAIDEVISDEEEKDESTREDEEEVTEEVWSNPYCNALEATFEKVRDAVVKEIGSSNLDTFATSDNELCNLVAFAIGQIDTHITHHELKRLLVRYSKQDIERDGVLYSMYKVQELADFHNETEGGIPQSMLRVFKEFPYESIIPFRVRIEGFTLLVLTFVIDVIKFIEMYKMNAAKAEENRSPFDIVQPPSHQLSFFDVPISPSLLHEEWKVNFAVQVILHSLHAMVHAMDLIRGGKHTVVGGHTAQFIATLNTYLPPKIRHIV